METENKSRKWENVANDSVKKCAGGPGGGLMSFDHKYMSIFLAVGRFEFGEWRQSPNPHLHTWVLAAAAATLYDNATNKNKKIS